MFCSDKIIMTSAGPVEKNSPSLALRIEIILLLNDRLRVGLNAKPNIGRKIKVHFFLKNMKIAA